MKIGLMTEFSFSGEAAAATTTVTRIPTYKERRQEDTPWNPPHSVLRRYDE